MWVSSRVVYLDDVMVYKDRFSPAAPISRVPLLIQEGPRLTVTQFGSGNSSTSDASVI